MPQPKEGKEVVAEIAEKHSEAIDRFMRMDPAEVSLPHLVNALRGERSMWLLKGDKPPQPETQDGDETVQPE